MTESEDKTIQYLPVQLLFPLLSFKDRMEQNGETYVVHLFWEGLQKKQFLFLAGFTIS